MENINIEIVEFPQPQIDLNVVTVQEIELPSADNETKICPSPHYDDSTGKDQPEELIFKLIESDDEDELPEYKQIYSDDEDEEEIIKEMLDYELNEQNDDVDKIVLKDVIIILNPQDVVVKKKRNYTEAHRRAQQKYREKYPEKYRELQRKVYNNLKQDDEWRKNFNEKNKESQKKYRDKKREEKIAQGLDVKPRGRPRKESIIKKPDAEIDL